ncbi:MAG: hypothetical protein CM1200mP6_03590 [Anaerolineaceae bacterium]|nr:MAG: hypothetical protein CM1200mP6_03590 [Anaerolineaceae bacterium]
MTNSVKTYLPNDVPPFGELVLLGFQHVLTMFPAQFLWQPSQVFM